MHPRAKLTFRASTLATVFLLQLCIGLKSADGGLLPVCGPFACNTTTSTCVSSSGSLSCVCLPGFAQLDPTQPLSPCVDINECTPNPWLNATCDLTREACVNTFGGYACPCYNSNCTDPCANNPCAIPTGRPCVRTLRNSFGYTCNCGTQGRLVNTTKGPTCIDRNDCVEDPMRCGSERSGARCVNQPFAPAICRCNFRPWPAWNATVKVCQQDFTHHCPFGRLWNATAGRCTDFDECATPDTAAVYCGHNATCANHDGSYSCSCQRYFRHWQFRSYNAAPGTQACYDEDGCVLGTTRSAVTKVCIADTDPCVLSGKPRCGNGTCTAQGSSFTCSCPLNYRWSVADNACVGVCDLVPGQRYWGGGFTTGRAADVLQPSPPTALVVRPEDCAGLCAAKAMCRVFVWRQMQCYLLSSSYTGRTPDDSYVSGACWFRMPPGAQNVALRGPTIASSVLASSLCLGGSCASRLAVDGSASSSGPPFSLFQSFSNASDRFPWIAVDLSTPCLVDRVVIYNRRDCCGNRLVAAELRLGDHSVGNGTQIPLNPVVWKQGGTAGAVLNITLPAHRQGRFIALQNRNPSTNSSDWALNVLEIEVHGHRLTEFNECSILGPASCDSATSTCQNIFGGAYKCKCRDGYVQGPDLKTCLPAAG